MTLGTTPPGEHMETSLVGQTSNAQQQIIPLGLVRKAAPGIYHSFLLLKIPV